jgi:lipase
LIRATRTDPPYVSEEIVSALDARLGSDFSLLDFDCDHMVAQSKPAETAEVIRGHAG